jgi:hypothetical protein
VFFFTDHAFPFALIEDFFWHASADLDYDDDTYLFHSVPTSNEQTNITTHTA